MPIDYHANADAAFRRAISGQGTVFDDVAGDALKKVATQRGIIKYMEAMAQVMAEAAIASQKATGDLPETAIRKWTQVVVKRAGELVREKQGTVPKQIEQGTVIDQEKPDAVD